MRRLIYAPIIHTDHDLGSLVGGVEEAAQLVVGQSNWQKHKQVVHLYWQAIAAYWAGTNLPGLKVFQDGMPVDGELGRAIVKKLAQDGSVNHQIIEQLLAKGAVLMKTEDPELVKEEYVLTQELVTKKSLTGVATFRYRRHKDWLLRARDAYIAKSIDEGIREGETAACFLGAYHHLLAILPEDIDVTALKDPEKVRAYYQNLTSNKNEAETAKLSRYLILPITRETGEHDE